MEGGGVTEGETIRMDDITYSWVVVRYFFSPLQDLSEKYVFNFSHLRYILA